MQKMERSRYGLRSARSLRLWMRRCGDWRSWQNEKRRAFAGVGRPQRPGGQVTHLETHFGRRWASSRRYWRSTFSARRKFKRRPGANTSSRTTELSPEVECPSREFALANKLDVAIG